MDHVPEAPGDPYKRLANLSPMNFSGISWYSDYPDHYAGDARTASAEKSRALRQISVDALAEFIAAVKADQVVPTLNKEFFSRERQLREK
jgi:creatinine amidohydrolase